MAKNRATKIQTVHIDNMTPGDAPEAKIDKLRAVLNGTTYMNLQVIAAPYQGSLVISVQGESIGLTQKELQGMVMAQLASAVMKG